MKGMRRSVRLFLGLLLAVCVLSMGGSRSVKAEEREDSSQQWTDRLLDDIDLQQVQKSVDGLLGEQSVDFREGLSKLLQGDSFLDSKAVGKLLWQGIRTQVDKEKGLFLQILLLVFAAAVFYQVSMIFQGDQLGEASFYVVYLVLFLLFVKSFGSLSANLQKNLELMSEFMRGLAPAYFLAVAASSGAGSAAVFYEMILMLVWLIQWALLKVLLPAANLYVLLRLVNHLSREDMLSRMADLIKSVIQGGLKTLLGLVTGLQIIKSMVTPVMDALKRSVIGKTAGAIPGVGGAVNAVTEIVITSAVLVRNCMGVAFLVILVMWGLQPILHYSVVSFFYKLAAALGEPVSDKRLIGALSTLGEGTGLLLRIFFDAMVLCMITIAVLAVSFGGGA